MQQAFGFEWLGHANDRAELVACGIIGGLRGLGQQNYRDTLQAIVALDDQAKIVAGHVGAFHFGEEDDRNGGLQNVESLLRGGNDDDGVTVIRKHAAHDVRGFGIGFDGQHHGLLLGVSGRGRTGSAGERRISGSTRIHRGVIFGVNELYGDTVLPVLFGDPHDFSMLRRIQMRGGGRIRENDINALAFPVTRARGREQQTKTRNVNALADFFKGFRAVHSANVNLCGDFGAFAAAAVGAIGRAGGYALRIWLGLCGGDWRGAHNVTSVSAGCVRPPGRHYSSPAVNYIFIRIMWRRE